jgi:hypothetical protein
VNCSSPKRVVRALLALVSSSVLLASSVVQAGTIEGKFDGVSPGDSINFTLNNGNTQSTTAGVFDWTQISGPKLASGNSFETFCIDLTHHISPGGTYKYNLDGPTSNNADAQELAGGLGATKAPLLNELFGKYYDPHFGNETAAAFQIAVWDIVYDGGVPTANSPFKVTSTGTAETDALLWLNNLDPNKVANLVILDSSPYGDHQNQITLQPTPEPSALVLTSIGIVGLLGMAWRRRMATA